MKNHILFASLITVSFLQFGCSASSDENQQSSENKLANVVSYSDITELIDESAVSSQKIQTMQDSDDPNLDIEDQVEVMSKRDKILIVGDSWATFSCVYNALGRALSEVKASISEDNRCLRTSKLGIEAREWIGSKQDKRVIKYLQKTPRLKYLYLSLGGNDMMATWHKDFTLEQEDQMMQKTFADVRKIANRYLAVRPDIKIILSGYDFPHFTPDHVIPLYKEIYERMGKPDHVRLNTALTKFSQDMVSLADGKNIFYIHHLGLSQYYDGVPENNFPAGLTLPPEQISTWHDPAKVGGDVHYQTSEKSMINWMYLARDAFHLGSRMYKNVMLHTYHNLLVHVIESDDQPLSQNYRN